MLWNIFKNTRRDHWVRRQEDKASARTIPWVAPLKAIADGKLKLYFQQRFWTGREVSYFRNKMNKSIDHSQSLTMRKINRKWLMVDSRSRKGIKKQRETGDYYQQKSQPLVLTGVLACYRWRKRNDSGEGSMYSGMRPRVGDGETDWKDDVRSTSAR